MILIGVLIAIIVYTLDMDLPKEVHNDPVMAVITEAGNDLLTWANDVYSLADTPIVSCVA